MTDKKGVEIKDNDFKNIMYYLRHGKPVMAFQILREYELRRRGSP